MIQSVSAYIDYFESIRRRTLNYIRAIPPEQIDWQPKADEFTCGDIVRHLAATEQMYVKLVLEGVWKYPGHARGEQGDLDFIVAEMNSRHTIAITDLRTLDDSQLQQTRPSFLPDSPPVKVWRWLMVMVEHEVHHRSQLASYLMLMGVEPPQIYGVKVEDLIAGSQ